MEIKNYERSEHFDRNEAVYVLHTIDGLSYTEIAQNFNLAIDEIQDIITMHKRYEAAVLEIYN